MRGIVARRSLAAALRPAGGRAPPSRGAGALRQKFHEPITAGASTSRRFDEAVTVFANAERRAHGRPPLQRDAKLLRAAAGHAHNMAQLQTHSHRLPVAGEGRLVQRMDRNGVRFRTAAENIGMEKVLRLLGRPIAAKAAGCAFTYADTGAAVPVHTYASLAAIGGGALDGVAQAPRLAAVARVPAHRHQRRDRPQGPGLRRRLPGAELRRLTRGGRQFEASSGRLAVEDVVADRRGAGELARPVGPHVGRVEMRGAVGDAARSAVDQQPRELLGARLRDRRWSSRPTRPSQA